MKKKIYIQKFKHSSRTNESQNQFDLGLFMSFFFPFKIKSTLMSVLKKTVYFFLPAPVSCYIEKDYFPKCPVSNNNNNNNKSQFCKLL